MTGVVSDALQRLTRACSGTEIDTTALTRSQYAYDASSYRVTPAAVAFPRDADQVAAVVRAAAGEGLAITPRGSGTSMAGNAVGPGVVLDLARHLNRVRAVDVAARLATVEAGVLLDDLQARVRDQELMFGPDPSSHSRVTFGGMVGNDACGNHSVAHGRTSDHVLAVEAVLADGTQVLADGDGLHPLNGADAARVAELDRDLRTLTGRHLATLRTQLDRVPRQVSGYHLHRLLPEHGFDVAKALAGSEGTLAVITAVTVRLVPRPTSTTMLIVGYDDLVDAAEDVPVILSAQPTAVEALDEAIVEAMRRRTGGARPLLPPARAWLYVEFGDAARVDDLVQTLDASGRCRGVRVVSDEADRLRLWRIREDGAGLVANRPGAARSWPGWEDAAVAPDRLAAYLRRFRRLLAEHGYRGVLYGHFGAGCVHIRIDFDTTTVDGRRRMAAFVRAAAVVVAEYGGTVSGEHGDGRARSELLPLMYAPETIAAFAQTKALFDSSGLLNPGVIVAPSTVTDSMLPAPRPAPSRVLALAHDGGDLGSAVGRCIGVGRCVAPTGGVMCPSYRATRREQDSTRGRARALQDLMAGTGPITPDDALATLDLCLSCKACSTDCPTGVDMASYKAAFLHEHYRYRMRPRTHYTLGWLPALTRLAGPAAPLVNRAVARPNARRAVARVGGITGEREFPALASRTDRRRALHAAPAANPAAVLFVDTFTRAFHPTLVTAATKVLADAGIPVAIAPSGCCGLTWITTGQLGIAARIVRRTVRRLAATGELPVIVLEPSCAAALVGDAPELVRDPSAQAVADRVVTFDHALRELARPGWRPPQLRGSAVVQTHCHERSVLTGSDQAGALRRSGLDDVREPVGCCGLAGNFGFEASHYTTSLAVAELALAPVLRAAGPDALLIADGFSCRTQIDHLTSDTRPARHLAEVLAEALDDPRPVLCIDDTKAIR